ncbi:PLP-dependent aminotransferase family protein [Salinisphaera sp. Q1T1-3]|uniref:MocR-like pyridoxine biosynthesis transcription factor PdxR n=1 Tax=Salinisphaera sp. Q1T1-3 TaxID=2321229 RepID=UPI000E751EA7|nr:PLP-dependent aminotransferase family protein [Salinisphaera sp. Q1T1-3]RJS93698.1 PLP-dependent aminotransferase family protein [Salinisphaera sp. Q1T1-3]
MSESREPVSDRAVFAWVIDGLNRRLAEPSGDPKQRRVYNALRAWIVSGELMPDMRLPSSRLLARETDMGRNTALGAIDQLVAEGFLVAREGAGVYVTAVGFAGLSDTPNAPTSDRLSQRGRAVLAVSPDDAVTHPAFTLGMPALDRFPEARWRRVVRRHQRPGAQQALHYRTHGGHPDLKAAIADYVRLARGVVCQADQILITHGTQQGLGLVATLLADGGDSAWIEDPGYLGARAAFQAADLRLIPVPVDDDGLDGSAVASAHPAPRLIYTTPSNQYPRGVTLALKRRLALLETARQHEAWIVEDDYDSELRYVSSPLACLQGLAGGAPVIYLGTFSKTLFPALQLGYIVVPRALISRFRRANARLFREEDPALQAALADFMNSGEFAAHIRKMRRCYRRRQAALREALAPATNAGLRLSSGAAGLHLVAYLDSIAQETRLVDEGAAVGVSLARLSTYFIGGRTEPGLVLGYAGADEAEIARPGGWLARAWRASQDDGS